MHNVALDLYSAIFTNLEKFSRRKSQNFCWKSEMDYEVLFFQIKLSRKSILWPVGFSSLNLADNFCQEPLIVFSRSQKTFSSKF